MRSEVSVWFIFLIDLIYEQHSGFQDYFQTIRLHSKCYTSQNLETAKRVQKVVCIMVLLSHHSLMSFST